MKKTTSNAAYDAAYSAAQAGGMNATESHEFATDQAERATTPRHDAACEGVYLRHD